jgi:hypothetical protein
LPRLLPFASPSSTIFQPPRCVLSVSAVPVVPESPPLPLARCLHISPDDRREEPPKAGAMRGAHPPRSPRMRKVHGEGETPAGGGKPSAAVCRQAKLSENRRARFGQLRSPRLARPAESSVNHAKRTARTPPRRARQRALAPPTDGHPPVSRQPHRQFNHYTTASQLRANCRKLQPIHNRPSTATSTILQPPSNHHPHAPRPSLLPSAATRQDILIPPTPLQDALQPCPNTEKAGGPKPARLP